MNEGKTSKYLKYAVGEIVLVVIGILIALQINNWNNARLNKIAELNFYLNFKEQMVEDIHEIEDNVEYNNKYINQFKHAVQIIEKNDRSKLDSLTQISMNLLKYSDVSRQVNIYESLVNGGEIKLLKNTFIKEEIRKLEELYIYVSKMEEIHKDVIINDVAIAISDNFKLLTQEVLNADNLYTVKYQNLLIIILGIMSEKDEVYHKSLAEIQTIIKYIDEEIDYGD